MELDCVTETLRRICDSIKCFSCIGSVSMIIANYSTNKKETIYRFNQINEYDSFKNNCNIKMLIYLMIIHHSHRCISTFSLFYYF